MIAKEAPFKEKDKKITAEHGPFEIIIGIIYVQPQTLFQMMFNTFLNTIMS